MNTLAHYQLYIDGSYCDGSQGQVENSINPATNQPWATFACASEDDVNRAVKAAKRALNDSTWRDMTQTDRGKMLYRLADLIENNAESIGQLRQSTAESSPRKRLLRCAMLVTTIATTQVLLTK